VQHAVVHRRCGIRYDPGSAAHHHSARKTRALAGGVRAREQICLARNYNGARHYNGVAMRRGGHTMIRKLPSGKYRLYSRKINPKTGKRRNLGTFDSRAAAEKHERAVQYFKRH
jgi:hypothetical protein